MKNAPREKPVPHNPSPVPIQQPSHPSIKENWLLFENHQIHCLEGGKTGPDVVLLHGGGPDCASLSWKHLLPELARHFHVLAPDLPGFGLSDNLENYDSIDTYKKFLQSFIEENRLSQISLVGLSMGGMLAIEYTLSQPDQVKKLVLVDCAGLGPDLPCQPVVWLLVRMPWLYRKLRRAIAGNRWVLRHLLKRLVFQPERLEPELIAEIQQQLRRPGEGLSWRRFLESEICWKGFRRCYLQRLGEIRVPTLLIHGEKDKVIPLRLSRQARRAISGSRLQVVAECGHWPPREKPEEFNRLVGEFLAFE